MKRKANEAGEEMHGERRGSREEGDMKMTEQ